MFSSLFRVDKRAALLYRTITRKYTVRYGSQKYEA